MRILYVTQFYFPESNACSFRVTDHSRIWQELGNEVSVYTAWPCYPAGILFDGWKVRGFSEESRDGLRVLRNGLVIKPNTSFFNKAICGVTFMFRGWVNLFLHKSDIGRNYDVVLTTSGTVFAGMLGCFVARRLRLPFVVEFRDIAYVQMAATGTDERSWKVRLMRRLELSLARFADEVVVLTESFKDALVSEGIPAEKIDVVPNGADIVSCDHEWSKVGCLRLGYFGTMGISQDVSGSLDLLASLSRSGVDVSYLLIGEGAARSKVEEDVTSGDYSFVDLRHGVSIKELEPCYSQVDMTVVSLQRSEGFSGTIPSKIFQSFARGVPVLFCGPEGEAARMVRESGAGLALTGEPEENAVKLRSFATSPDLAIRLEDMSKAAVDYLNKGYTRRALAERMLEVLSRACGDAVNEEGD